MIGKRRHAGTVPRAAFAGHRTVRGTEAEVVRSVSMPSHRSPSSVSARSRSGQSRTWLPRTWLRLGAISLAVIATILMLAVLREARLFAIPTVLAALFALTLSPLARRFEQVGVPPALAAFGLVFGSVLALGFAFSYLAPTAEVMGRELPQILRRLEEMARAFDGAATGEGDGNGEGGALVASGRAFLAAALFEAPTFAGAALYAVFLTFFLLWERARLARLIYSLAPDLPVRLSTARAFRQIRLQVASYLLAVSTINIALGFAVTGAFLALGVPNAPAWGAAATLLNFAPYLGPLALTVAVLLVGVATGATVEEAVAPALVLMALNTLEGYLITPRIVGNRVQIGPLGVFFAVAFGAWLWGAAGALLATPTLIVIRTFALGPGRPKADRPPARLPSEPELVPMPVIEEAPLLAASGQPVRLGGL